jgi:hypothetical protein
MNQWFWKKSSIKGDLKSEKSGGLAKIDAKKSFLYIYRLNLFSGSTNEFKGIIKHFLK